MAPAPRALDHSSERLLTIDEIAEVLHCKKAWIYERTCDGSMPVIRLGGRMLRFSLPDVMEWVRSQSNAPAAPAPRAVPTSGS
jgi:excisionase family DNA binding protein